MKGAMFNTEHLKAGRVEMFLAKLFGKTTYIHDAGYTWRFDQFRGNMYVSEVKQKMDFPKF
jgi:hypothetical protein